MLKSSKLIEVLKKYGKVQFTGSYSFDLMLNGDIDIEVINPNFNKQKVGDTLSEIIQKGYFKGYMFYDWVKFRKKKFPKGYYIGLKIRKNNIKWKIDIWCLKKENIKKAIQVRNLIKKSLTPQNKYNILKLKDFRNKYYPDIESVVIYEAVLNKGIKTIKDFKNYIQQAHPGYAGREDKRLRHSLSRLIKSS